MLLRTVRRACAVAFFAAVTLPLVGTAQSTDLKPGRFDFGKMWTFEYAPSEYFSTTYGFNADDAWFERARLAALRIPGCSASFVSPDGLVVTNHHCARGSVSAVTRPGESLLDDGFFSSSMDEERPIPNAWADQLLSAQDVTAEIDAAVAGVSEAQRDDARAEAIKTVQARLAAEHEGTPGIRVQVVPLYNGGRYSAYVFRRFTDIRLVAAAELNMGFFGGDPDNFTYPRYALDFAFYRVYVDGKPFHPTHWFTWGEGVKEGDPVFVIGNPGPTNRLQTVAQLEYQRDVLVPMRKAFFESRLQVLRDVYAADPVAGEKFDLRNRAFSLSNSLKAYTGRLDALRDPEILGLKRAAEEEFLGKLADDTQLQDRYGSVVEGLAKVQGELRRLGPEMGAFYFMGNSTYGSRTLVRGMRAAAWLDAKKDGAPADSVADLARAVTSLEDYPGDMEEELLRLRMADFQRYLGDNDPLVEQALGGRSPEGAATSLLERSALSTQASATKAVESGTLSEDDPALMLARYAMGRVMAYSALNRPLSRREDNLAADLGRARFEVYGTEVAPDATSSPRITDGVVKPYEYNGTLAPTHTTFYGVYDRYYGHLGNPDWALPARWVPVPEALDLSTPLNFISTSDTYGGNSGSPAVTKKLELVGLNFDRNIEGLSRDFIYLPDRGRNIMVDVRAIKEALTNVYHADRIVEEITSAAKAGAGR